MCEISTSSKASDRCDRYRENIGNVVLQCKRAAWSHDLNCGFDLAMVDGRLVPVECPCVCDELECLTREIGVLDILDIIVPYLKSHPNYVPKMWPYNYYQTGKYYDKEVKIEQTVNVTPDVSKENIQSIIEEDEGCIVDVSITPVQVPLDCVSTPVEFSSVITPFDHPHCVDLIDRVTFDGDSTPFPLPTVIGHIGKVCVSIARDKTIEYHVQAEAFDVGAECIIYAPPHSGKSIFAAKREFMDTDDGACVGLFVTNRHSLLTMFSRTFSIAILPDKETFNNRCELRGLLPGPFWYEEACMNIRCASLIIHTNKYVDEVITAIEQLAYKERSKNFLEICRKLSHSVLTAGSVGMFI